LKVCEIFHFYPEKNILLRYRLRFIETYSQTFIVALLMGPRAILAFTLGGIGFQDRKAPCALILVASPCWRVELSEKKTLLHSDGQ
jgi:hypothetical protein